MHCGVWACWITLYGEYRRMTGGTGAGFASPDIRRLLAPRRAYGRGPRAAYARRAPRRRPISSISGDSASNAQPDRVGTAVGGKARCDCKNQSRPTCTKV